MYLGNDKILRFAKYMVATGWFLLYDLEITLLQSDWDFLMMISN